MLSGGVKLYAENLGEFLRGDKIENSPYEVRAEKLRVYCVCILVDKRWWVIVEVWQWTNSVPSFMKCVSSSCEHDIHDDVSSGAFHN